MLTALRDTPDANAILPFVRLFYGSPSEFVWTDAANTSSFVWQQGTTTRHIYQLTNKGTPLNLALFCLGLQPALHDLQREFRADLGECVLAYLDDVTILASPQRVLHLVSPITPTCASTLPKPPSGMELALLRMDSLSSRQTPCLVRRPVRGPVLARSCAPRYPFGEPGFIARHLQALSDRHEGLLTALPRLGDTQVSWLPLFYTAASHSQLALRTLAPRLTRDVALAHDARVLTALSTLLLAERNTTAPCCIAWLCCYRSTLPRRTRCPTSLSAGPICRFPVAGGSATSSPQDAPGWHAQTDGDTLQRWRQRRSHAGSASCCRMSSQKALSRVLMARSRSAQKAKWLQGHVPRHCAGRDPRGGVPRFTSLPTSLVAGSEQPPRLLTMPSSLRLTQRPLPCCTPTSGRSLCRSSLHRPPHVPGFSRFSCSLAPAAPPSTASGPPSI